MSACAVCGKEMGRRKTCPVCARLEKMWSRLPANEREIARIARKARTVGMTYGKYVARCEG